MSVSKPHISSRAGVNLSTLNPDKCTTRYEILHFECHTNKTGTCSVTPEAVQQCVVVEQCSMAGGHVNGQCGYGSTKVAEDNNNDQEERTKKFCRHDNLWTQLDQGANNATSYSWSDLTDTQHLMTPHCQWPNACSC